MLDFINEKDNRYTISEFKNNLNECIDIFLNKLNGFDKSLVEQKIFIEKNQTIQIKLNSAYKKYSFEENEFVKFNKVTSTIAINNLSFYNQIDLSVNTNLQNKVQDFIEDKNRKYTKEEFEQNIKDLKNIIIDDIDGLNNDDISSLEVNSENKLIITLTNNEKTKFVIKQKPDNLVFEEILVNGKLTPRLIINKLNFFNSYNITNVEIAYQNLLKDINLYDNRYTQEEFENKLSFIMNSFYDELKMNENKFDKNFASQIFNKKTNEVEITLNKDFKKYNVESNNNVTFDKNQSIIKIKNLNFYIPNYINIKTNLKNLVQSFISDPQRKYTLDEFSEQQNLEVLKTKILDEITGLNIGQINKFEVQNNNLVFTLNLPSTSEFEKFVINGETADIELKEIQLDNKCWTYQVTISELNYFNEYNITDTELAFKALENEITKTTNRYTKDEFEKKFNDTNSKDEIMTSIYQSLKMNDGEFIKQNVKNSTFLSDQNINQININLDTNFKKYKISNENSNVVLEDENSTLSIKNIQLYSQVNIDVHDDLFTNVQDFIKEDNRRYTTNEFNKILEINDESLRATLASSIEGIEKEEIISMEYNNNEFIFKLANVEYKKYNLTTLNLPKNIIYQPLNDENAFAFFKISNLNFYTIYNIENANEAYNALVDNINDISNRYTIDEFKTNIANCLDTFYNELSNFDKNDVKTYNLDNLPTNLSIQLNNDNFKKYKLSNDNNINFDELSSTITINNLNFYNEIELTILDGLYTDIQNLIKEDTKQYTQDELLQNKNIVKEKVVNKINGLNTNQIDNVEIDSEKNLILTLNITDAPLSKHVFKNQGNNVTVRYIEIEGSYKYQIIISKLKYYIYGNSPLSEEKLKEFWNTINQKVISTNLEFSSQAADDQWSNKKPEIIDAITNTTDEHGVKLGEYIDNPDNDITRELTNINIKMLNYTPPTANENELVKFKDLCFEQGYIQVKAQGNVISLNNLLIGNPEKYFTWNGNTITGLTAEGKKEENILFPKRATAIGDSAFSNRNSSNQQQNNYWFKRAILSDNIKSVGRQAFNHNQHLVMIKFPKELTLIRDETCIIQWNHSSSNLETIYLYNKLTTIEQYSFTRWNVRTMKGNYSFNEFVLPPSIKRLERSAFWMQRDSNNDKTLKFTTWATNYNFAAFGDSSLVTISNALTVNLLADSIDRAETDTFPHSNTTINVKTDLVKRQLQAKYNWNINIAPNLADLYPAEKYCPVHGIDK